MPESCNSPIEILFYELDRLANKYEELTDTDVREALHITLNYFFVWGKNLYQFPVSYGMFSVEGDQAIAQAVDRFLSSVKVYPDMNNVSVGKERLSLLQNEKIVTPGGRQYYEFIGHVDEPLPLESLPDYLFEEGDYDD
jgi:hypothetical protein